MDRKKRILLIDDDVPFSISTQITLEDTGEYELRVENDSTKAIDAAREFRPDLILLDIVMPGFDGGDIRLMLRDDPDLRDIPVLIVTAMVSRDDTDEHVVESREQVMFSKPINLDKLLAEIERILASKPQAS